MRRGFSLIEIVIGILIIGILLFPVTIFFNQTIKNYTYRKPDAKVVEVVTDAINEIETLLRGAKNIGIAESTKIGFIIPYNGGEKKIIFELYNGLIRRTDDLGTKYTPYYNNPNTPISELINFEIGFKYYDESNNLLPYGSPDRVRVVEISIKGEPAQHTSEVPTFSLTTKVKLRNIN